MLYGTLVLRIILLQSFVNLQRAFQIFLLGAKQTFYDVMKISDSLTLKGRSTLKNTILYFSSSQNSWPCTLWERLVSRELRC